MLGISAHANLTNPPKRSVLTKNIPQGDPASRFISFLQTIVWKCTKAMMPNDKQNEDFFVSGLPVPPKSIASVIDKAFSSALGKRPAQEQQAQPPRRKVEITMIGKREPSSGQSGAVVVPTNDFFTVLLAPTTSMSYLLMLGHVLFNKIPLRVRTPCSTLP